MLEKNEDADDGRIAACLQSCRDIETDLVRQISMRDLIMAVNDVLLAADHLKAVATRAGLNGYNPTCRFEMPRTTVSRCQGCGGTLKVDGHGRRIYD